MNEMTYVLIRVVVTVLAALISAYLIPYLKRLSENEKYKDITEVVKIAVQAAEQTIKGAGKGVEKKQEVIMYVSNWLNMRGITLSTEELSQIIESAVYTLKNGGNV